MVLRWETWGKKKKKLFMVVLAFVFLCLYKFAHSCSHKGDIGVQSSWWNVVSLFMCVYLCVCVLDWVHICVWSPRNDYYGLTPISRIESLHPWFFHSPGNGKENISPSVAYYWDLLLWHPETPKHTLILTHTHLQKHMLTVNRWQANIGFTRCTESGCS